MRRIFSVFSFDWYFKPLICAAPNKIFVCRCTFFCFILWLWFSFIPGHQTTDIWRKIIPIVDVFWCTVIEMLYIILYRIIFLLWQCCCFTRPHDQRSAPQYGILHDVLLYVRNYTSWYISHLSLSLRLRRSSVIIWLVFVLAFRLQL